MASDEDWLHFNGIDVASGGYGMPPMTTEKLASIILQRGEAPENDDDLAKRKKQFEGSPEERARLERELAEKTEALQAARAATAPDQGLIDALTREAEALRKEISRRAHLGVVEGVDPLDLAQAGWGAVFPRDADPAIREALTELFELRAAQAGERFRLYEGRKGYKPGEKKSKFLKRNGTATSGPVEPDKMPYYLLLVGSPEEIPYSFQYQLDVQYAVGRIWFATADEYANYARSVVEAETKGISRAKRVSIFGVDNPDDKATELSARLLARPLAEKLIGNDPGWEVRSAIGDGATRATLESMLGGSETPALLFTASHGAELPRDDSRQRAHQGALLCRDWPGPEQWKEPIPERFYLAGEHLSSSADIAGMMLFAFACFGAGTPEHDEFARLTGQEAKQIADAPFVSGLALSMLGRPNGALAMVGHVDRAWGCSFSSGAGERARSYTATFQSSLERLIKGQPVGHALDYFNVRYAELSTELTEELQDEFVEPDPFELTSLWTANNDARGYVVFGDPAAKLTFTGGATLAKGAVPSLVSSGPDDGSADAPTEEVLARPAEISVEDWELTPLAVKRYIAQVKE